MVPEFEGMHPNPKEEAPCDPTLEEELKKELEVDVHHIPPPPSPFQVKAIPDNLEQPSFLFKYGVLGKWHIEEEETDASTPPPPHTESEEEIKSFVYGDEEAKGGNYEKREKSTKEESPTDGCSKSFERCRQMGTREDEWVEEFGIHSGRFKLLASPPY